MAKRVTRWDAYDNIWLGEVSPDFQWERPVRVFVQRRLKKDKVIHIYYVSTLTIPSKKTSYPFIEIEAGQKLNNFVKTKAA